MFRIACYVDDKDLARALHSLAGIAKHMDVPQPVVNAKEGGNVNGSGHVRSSNGKLHAATSGYSHDMVRQFLLDNKATSVSLRQIGDILEKSGAFKRSASQWVRKRLVDQGFLKNTRVKGVWSVSPSALGKEAAREEA